MLQYGYSTKEVFAMQTVPAKSVLSVYREDGWFGSNYTINLYRGCCHGCIDCDSRSDCYQIDKFDTVKTPFPC